MTAKESGGRLIARALHDEGVAMMFGIIGHSDIMVEDAMVRGINTITVRHEQAAVYAADAYSRSSRTPSVAFTSMAPGAMNALPGMFHAAGANSPVVLLAGGPAVVGDGMNLGQSGGHTATIAHVVERATKLCQRITDPSTTAFWVREAVRRSLEGVPGPVALEIPTNIMMGRSDSQQLRYVSDPARVAGRARSQGDPAAIVDVVERLIAAKRPVIFNGDSVYWSNAAAELVELVELLRIPTCGRRMGRGALPETHELSFTPSLRRGFLEEADLICLLGQQVSQLDEYYETPSWNHACQWVQVQPSMDLVWYGIPTDAVAIGDMKLVLRQMIDVATQLLADRTVEHNVWTAALATAKERRRASVRRVVEIDRGNARIHPNVLCQDLIDVMDGSATMILDSFTASTHLTDKLEAAFAGQVLDAGLYQTLGHSIGMAIGAKAARPDRQVVSLIGDGGFGIGGMDMETLARYNLPAVVVLFNNKSWGGRAWGHDLYYPGRKGTGDISTERYDQMFEPVGCHTEYVTDQVDIKPALERAFESGKPALVNVIGDTEGLNAVRMRVNLLDTWARQNFDELPEEAQRELRAMPRPIFEWAARHRAEYDAGVTVEKLIDFVKPDFATQDTL